MTPIAPITPVVKTDAPNKMRLVLKSITMSVQLPAVCSCGCITEQQKAMPLCDHKKQTKINFGLLHLGSMNSRVTDDAMITPG